MAMDEARLRRRALLMTVDAARRMRSGLKDGAPLGSDWPANDVEQCRDVQRMTDALREGLEMAKRLKWMDAGTSVYNKTYSEDAYGVTMSFGIRREADNPGGPLQPLPDAVLTLCEALQSVGYLPPVEKEQERANAEREGGYLHVRDQARAADEVYEAKVWLRVFQTRGWIDPAYVIAEEEREDGPVFYISAGGKRMTPLRFHAGRDESRGR